MNSKIDDELAPECSCCSCCSSCETNKQEFKASPGIHRLKLISVGIGIIFFLTALAFKFSYPIRLTLYITSYLLIGGEILFYSARNIRKGQFLDENFLMSLATIGAFAIGEFPEAVAVMLFYQVGEFFQEMAIQHSKRSITALMDIRPDFAYLKKGSEVQRVCPDEVTIGDIIIIKPGDKVPLDGKIIDGSSSLDTSALTGESALREVAAGNEILSGSINKSGLLTVAVSKEFGESTVSKILDLVQNAATRKAPTENFITKFARYYTPAVVLTAAALAFIPPLITGAPLGAWVSRALVFLVVSCPCALVISIPLSFFGGIGGASKNGILIKGSNYLEALNNVDTVVFDKTGTLTQGVFQVTKIESAGDFSENDLLEYAAFSESYSTHPIALSILKAYGNEINSEFIRDYSEIPGYGVRTLVKGKTVLAGNERLMKQEAIPYAEITDIGTAVHIAVDHQYAGFIVISDEIKKDSLNTILELRTLGIQKLVMLTGDHQAVGVAVGKHLGLDQIHAELLPDQKVALVEQLEREKASPKGKLVFMGDGINDAPVLARADIGIAMGGVGSDAAIEAADVVLMTDEPSKLVTAIKIAKRTRLIVTQNIYLALGVKGIVLLLGALGFANMWEAVFADVGVALLAVLNSMRVMTVKNKESLTA
jgi:Zn2+/Cd2+-exporting ATPase